MKKQITLEQSQKDLSSRVQKLACNATSAKLALLQYNISPCLAVVLNTMQVNAKAAFKATQNRTKDYKNITWHLWAHTFINWRGQAENSLGFVKVHDAMDNLHRGVPTEEGDLVRKLLGG